MQTTVKPEVLMRDEQAALATAAALEWARHHATREGAPAEFGKKVAEVASAVLLSLAVSPTPQPGPPEAQRRSQRPASPKSGRPSASTTRAGAR